MKSLILACALFLASSAPLAASNGSISYAPLPLQFQTGASSGCFTAQATGFALTLCAGDATLDLADGAAPLRLRLAAAQSATPAAALEPLPGRTLYLRGRDPAGWRTNVASWGRVRYRGIYPGIDLIFYGRQNELEYDFTAAPGADLGAIRLDVSGARSVRLDNQGNVVLTAESGRVKLHKPLMYQMVAGRKRLVAGGFRLSNGQIGFSVEAYDAKLPLVVDPVLSYATFIGRGANDRVNAVAVGPDGSTYAAGVARAAGAPGHDEAFVAHLSADGKTLESMTMLGGSGASEARGIALDAAGNVWITGQTAAADFPVLNAIHPFCDMNPSGPCQGDAFVAKLGPDGSLAFATYLGGSGADAGNAIAVDSTGDVYIAGVTESRDFPAASAAQPSAGGQADGFVAKIAGDGSHMVYATYLGGSGADQALGIAVDSKLNAYVTGQTGSFDFPLAQPMQAKCRANPAGQCAGEAFVSKLSADGTSLVYSTYLGGSGGDQANAIAVDADGQAHIAGVTSSDDFPLATPIQAKRAGKSEAFAAALRADGSSLLYATFLGGTGDDAATAIALDAAGMIYVGGHTDSADFPLKSPAQKTCKQDPKKGECSQDAFVAVLSKAGVKLDFSTYLGGTGTDQGNGIAVARDGYIHLGGASTSTDFPSVRSAEAKPAPEARTVHAGALIARLTPMAQTCTANWSGGGSTKNWSNTSNWSGKKLPGAGDIVCILSSFSSITAIVDTDFEITSLISSASVTVNGGTTLTLDGTGGSSVSGTLTLYGTIQGNDSLTIAKTLAFEDGAQLCGPDCSSTPDQPPKTAANGGITTPSGGANVSLYGRELDNAQTATFNGNSSYSFTADNGAIISNPVGATWTLHGNNSMSGSVWQFNNAGTFTKTSGTGTSSVTPSTFTNTGTVSMGNSTGTLAIENPDGAGGIWQAGTSATLALSSASSSSLGGTFSGGGSLGFTGPGGIINFTSATTIGLPVTVDDCTVNFATGATGGSGITIPSVKLQDQGILAGTDTLTISGTLAWNGNTSICTQIETDGSCHTAAGANALLYTKGPITTPSQGYEYLWGRTLNNSSTATFNYSGCGLDLSYGGKVNNSGTWALSSQCGIDSPTGDGVFNNSGTFTSANSSGQSSTVSPQAFINTGSVQVNSGILSVVNPVNLGTPVGTWTVAAGADLQLAANSATDYSTNFGGAFTGPGTLEFVVGTLNLTYPSSFNLPVAIDLNAVANFMTGSAVTIQQLTIMSGAILTGPDTVNVTGMLNWNDTGQICAAMSGAWCSAGTAILNAGGGITTLANKNETWYLSYRTLNNSGTATFSGTAASGLTLDGGTVYNLAGGIWNIASDSAITATSSGGAFHNAGTFQKTAGTSSSEINPATFTNTGTVTVTCPPTTPPSPCSDTLSIENLGNSSGTWTAAAGATLQLGAGTNPATLSGTFSGTSASSIGQLQFTTGPLFAAGGIIDIVTPATFSLPVTINNTAVNFQTGSEVKLPSLTLANYGTLAGPDTVTVNGMLNWQDLGYACTSLTSTGECDVTTGGILNANGGITLPGGAWQYLLGRTLNNPGPGITVSATNTAACGGETATFQLGYSAIVNNAGTWNFAGSCSLYTHNSTGTFNNSGTFEKTAAASVDQIYSGVTFANTGTVTAGSGTLEFMNGYTQTTSNGSTFLNGGSITADAPLVIQGGFVTGSGTITGDVNNSGGTLAPGTAATQSAAATTGTVTVSSNYTQGSAAAFNVKIGGTGTGQYDVLKPGSNAALLGTLNVSLINNFSPAINNGFTIVSGPYSGTFSPTNFPTLPAGEGWSIAYNSNAVVLNVVAINGPAAKINPASLTFDNTPIGQASGVKTIALSNTGTTALTIGSIQVTGTNPSDFQYTKDGAAPCGASLAAGAGCTLDITFTPANSGARSAQVTITDNSGNVNNTTQTIGLSGTGLAITSIQVTAGNSSISVNATDQFTATATYSDSSQSDITARVTWLASPPGLVTFSATTPGLATAGSTAGQTNVTASLGGVTSNTYQLTIGSASQNTIAVSSGSPQSAAVSTAFANPLVAAVKDGNGNPLSGVSVTFTAPASGAGGTFSNGQATYATTTNASGLASATFTANATAGPYSVTATITGTSIATSFSLTNTSASAGLSITKTHTGNFIPGQTNASYSITVTNNGTAATSGPVTVIDSPPTGLTINQMTGTGWTCTVPSCTSNAAMASGQSLSIAVTATVANGASASLTNQASVSVGGNTLATASNVTVLLTGITVTAVSSSLAPAATDQFTATGTYSDGSTANLTGQVTWASGSQNVATINSAGLATGVAGGQSSITATLDAVAGSFTLTVNSPSQTTIAVSSGSPQSAQIGTAFANPLIAVVSGSAISGVQVTFTAPASGAGGTFSNGQTTYTTNTDSSGHASAAFTANASAGSYTVTATVAGAASAANFSLSNTSAPPPVLSITKNHTDPFLQGQTNASYTVTVTNTGAGPTSGTVTVTETLPSGMTLASISGGTTWNCTSQPIACNTNSVLAAGASYTPITVAVNVLGNAASPQVNSVSVSGGGSSAAASTTDSTTIVAVTTNTLTIPTAIGAAPGGTFNIPLTLALSGNTSIDSLTFALQITPIGGASPFTTPLSFTPDSSITDSPLASTNGTDYAIAVAWSSFTKTGNLSGTRVIGTVNGTVPGGAGIGQTYTVTITNAGATNGGQVNLVTVTPGLNGTLTVSNTYLVGDVYSYTSDMAPHFGDGTLTNLDVVQVLFAVNKVPGFVPQACSDRYDAMDTYPVDTAGARGGDGSLDIRDLIREMFRASLLDPARPTRASRGGCGTPSSQTAKLAAAPAEIEASLSFGALEAFNDTRARMPVYLDARSDLARVALTFALGDGHSQLAFVPAQVAPSMSPPGQAGMAAVAWLEGLSVRSGERLLLGYVEGPAAALPGVQLYGMSAVRLEDDRIVRLDAPGLLAGSR